MRALLAKPIAIITNFARTAITAGVMTTAAYIVWNCWRFNTDAALPGSILAATGIKNTIKLHTPAEIFNQLLQDVALPDLTLPSTRNSPIFRTICAQNVSRLPAGRGEIQEGCWLAGVFIFQLFLSYQAG